jgi:hypothetical protein
VEKRERERERERERFSWTYDRYQIGSICLTD